MKALTDRQKEVLTFIHQEVAKKNYPPSVREICTALGLSSSATAHAHLSVLETKGYIRRNPTKPRAIELLKHVPEEGYPLTKTVYVPVVGQVTAGEPILATENIENYFPLPKEMVDNESETFMLQIQGNSMKNAGILDGDYVIIRQQTTAQNGDIVVALLDDEATVKRFFIEKEHIRLQPENESYKPIFARDIRILGKIIGVFRHI